jgi:hypothetical protein
MMTWLDVVARDVDFALQVRLFVCLFVLRVHELNLWCH